MTDDQSSTAGDGGGEARDLVVSLDRMTRRPGQVELRLTMENPRADRALHYVAGVRAILYDDATATFEVRLTDAGRELVPGAANVFPPFGVVDPTGTSVLTVRLPDSIVRMLPGAGPDGEVRLEEVTLSPTSSIEVVVGWSDTAFYPDPRVRSAGVSTLLEWESGQARLVVPPADAD